MSGLDGTGDGEGYTSPALGFVGELAAAGFGEAIVLGATIIFGLAPGGDEPAFLLHAVQSGKKRAGLDLESAAGELFDAAGDAKAVHRLKNEGFEDHHIEGALKEIGLRVGWLGHWRQFPSRYACSYRRSLGRQVSSYRWSMGRCFWVGVQD